MAKRATTAKRPEGFPRYHCGLRTFLPTEPEIIEAAAHAVRLNPANEPVLPMKSIANLAGVAAAKAIADNALAAALLTSKWWGSGGVNHSVACTSRVTSDFTAKLLHSFNQWGLHANVKFYAHTGANWMDADLRYSLGPGGYYSFLGSDNARIPRNQHNMNLQGFSTRTTQSEWDRVPPHEVAHHLGMPHEHQRAGILARLDKNKTVAVYRREQGWSVQEVDRQIFNLIAESAFGGFLTPPDEEGIQTYWFSGECTKDGRPIIGGKRINANDHAVMAKAYPKADAPPPPPVGTYRYLVESPVELPASLGFVRQP